MKSILSKIKGTKLEKVLPIVAILMLFLVVIGGTYAYFRATGTVDAVIPSKVQTATTDMLTFSVSKDIVIDVTENNFIKDGVDRKDDAVATALYRAGSNVEGIIEAYYNVYLVIESNNLIKTTEEEYPELLLRVTNPKGEEVTSITGLHYYEDEVDKNYKGFDITKRSGGYLLVPNYKIEATSEATTRQDWKIEIIFKNLKTNQNKNQNKSVVGKIVVTRENMPSYVPIEVTSSEVEVNGVTATMNLDYGSSTADAKEYYYGYEKIEAPTAYVKLANTNEIEWKESNTDTYTFKNLEENSAYNFYGYIVDSNGIKSNVYKVENIETKDYRYSRVIGINTTSTLDSIEINVTDVDTKDGEVATYNYSCDNGENWSGEIESVSYTCKGLSHSSTYQVIVKGTDEHGKEVLPYTESVETEIYKYLKIESAGYETTHKSIKIKNIELSEEKTTSELERYEYSINGGTYQETC